MNSAEIEGKLPSADQINVLQYLFNQMKRQGGNHDVPFFMLLTGGPGSGKSHLIALLQKMALSCGFGRVLTTAYSGVAASHVSGRTFCSLFMVPFASGSHGGVSNETSWSCERVKPLKEPSLRLLKETLRLEDLCCIVIDEISMITPRALYVLDHRLRQATGNDRPFGNVSIILCGDLRQLPPVRAISIHQGAVEMALYDKDLAVLQRNLKRAEFKDCAKRYKIDSPIRKGLELLRLFQWWELTSQHRSCDDMHSDIVRRMWLGEGISMEDLKEYKPLQTCDVIKDKDWLLAPMIVATNQERMAIIHFKAVELAKMRGTHVVRWPLVYRKWQGAPQDPLHRAAALQDPSFYEYFVSGCDAFVTSNFCPQHGLANGSPVVYHSITMASEAEQDKVIQWMQLNPPGSILTLERPPLSLNIVVAIKNSKDNILTQLTRDEDIGLDLSTSLVCETDEENIPCKIIVPIPCLPKMSEWHKRSISGNRSMGYGPSKAEVRDYFKAEMAMAITTHKAEGRTMDRIVLALQDRPTKIVQMTYTSILVALSRVHRREDVRILMSGEYGYRSLEYILDLKPSPYLNLFFAGYENNREEWNADLVVSRYRKLHRAIGRL